MDEPYMITKEAYNTKQDRDAVVLFLQIFGGSVALCSMLFFIFITISGYNRYNGHNGYHFFWNDMKMQHLFESDANNDGQIDSNEIDAFIRNKVVQQGYKIYDCEVYTKENKLLTAKDCAKMFLKNYNEK